ncbi:transcription factor domain-containing protein [Aspergillus niger CBS 101883]|uniref:transcription factor domain-containing protein n=1 Tax=Aspergillus lacticoffeatus (strain CBS 101883) TaxID=1450533 RepID=UPI000D7F2013|nr:fungal-specific transcription factor [Aspergillus niger CBS 101883]PYH62128.1 fungal-specific transcription factor [Aspergillus niger CBS 101883]
MSSPQVLPPLPNTRRIITTHNASRSATIAINEHKEPTALEDGTYLNPLWSSDELPATIDQDPTKIQPNPTAATTGGSVFSTYDLPPKYEGPMHRSITLDYITVTQGVVTLSTDDGSTVTLRAGDTVVQRGTMHKWGNPSDEWASSTISLLGGAFSLHNVAAPGPPATNALPGAPLREPGSASPSIEVETSDLPSSTALAPYDPSSSVLNVFVSLLPNFDAASLLVDTYFDRVHWFMLIFYQDEFRQRWPKLYDRSTERPLTYAHRHLGFLSTFLIVIAIGLQYAGPYRQGILSRHGVDINLRDRILFTVRSGLLDIMSLGSLEAVQTCILLGTYYLYHGAPRLAWPVCGCGLRIAQALHLHRRQHPVQSTDFRTRNETRKRCWWAVYEIETFSAVAYGYPHSIRDDDCDVEPLDPSAKLQTMQSPGSFNEPLTSDPTLLSYKYFITNRSHTNSPDIQRIVRKVADYDNRLRQWEAEIPSPLQWRCVSHHSHYASAEEVDRAIGASGPRFENHIYQLQALALWLAYQNARILTHRPLLSYTLATRERTSKYNGEAAYSVDPFRASLNACRDAALSMSEILSSPLLEIVPETYAASFVSIHTFTAGVTLGILSSMDPLGPQSAETKSGLRKLIGIQDKLRTHSVAAQQGLSILQRLAKLVLEKELSVMMELSTSTTTARSDEATITDSPSTQRTSGQVSDRSIARNDIIDPIEVSTAIPALDIPAEDGSAQYMHDPALTAALQDFDQALSNYAPRVSAGSDSCSENPSFWPTTEGFPILEQSWIWGLEGAPLYGEYAGPNQDI